MHCSKRGLALISKEQSNSTCSDSPPKKNLTSTKETNQHQVIQLHGLAKQKDFFH
jgi:hypothetical protein